MRNEDNDCIRYLMKEMDPSEELLMERAMMEDEDLLIEVESMRQTLQKLDKLPQVEPPKEVTDSIMEKASKHAAERRKANRSFKPMYKYAVAATLALTITAGGTWFFIGQSGKENAGKMSQVSQTQADPSVPAVNESDKLRMASSNNLQEVSAKSGDYKVEPWVDRNEILRFGDQFDKGNNEFDALLKNATKKLHLIDQPDITNHRVKSIQLTGSRQ